MKLKNNYIKVNLKLDMNYLAESIGGLTKKQALEGSIEKWKTIVALHKAGIHDFDEGGIDTCALCDSYYVGGCEGCPVKEKTELACCDGTPYEKYQDVVSINKKLKFAKQELVFLKSLRKSVKK